MSTLFRVSASVTFSVKLGEATRAKRSGFLQQSPTQYEEIRQLGLLEEAEKDAMRSVTLMPLLPLAVSLPAAFGFLTPVGTATARSPVSRSIPLRATEDSWSELIDDATEPASAPATRNLFLISDSTGVILKSALQKSLAQFQTCEGDGRVFANRPKGAPPCEGDDGDDDCNECEVQTRMFNFIRSESAVASIVKTAREKNAMILFTLADPVLVEQTMRMVSSCCVGWLLVWSPNSNDDLIPLLFLITREIQYRSSANCRTSRR